MFKNLYLKNNIFIICIILSSLNLLLTNSSYNFGIVGIVTAQEKQHSKKEKKIYKEKEKKGQRVSKRESERENKNKYVFEAHSSSSSLRLPKLIGAAAMGILLLSSGFKLTTDLYAQYCPSLRPMNSPLSNEVSAFGTDIRLGSEFTFFHPSFSNSQFGLPGNIISNRGSEEGMMKLSKGMVEKCGSNCKMEKIVNRYGAVNYNITHVPSGIWINVGTDPSTIETQMKPITLRDYEENEKMIDDLLFKTAADLGYHPDTTLNDNKVIHPNSHIPFLGGGGHIHMGVAETFRNDPLVFRNFLVYVQNHPYLFQWGFGNYPTQAPTLAIQIQKMRDNFARIIHDFDSDPSKYTILKLANRLNSEVFSTTLDTKHGPAKKYQAFSLQRISKNVDESEWTVEFRSFGPQRNVKEFTKQATFLSSIIEHIRKIKEPVPYKNIVVAKVLGSTTDPITEYYSTPQNRKAMVYKDFQNAMAELGLDAHDYTSILNRYIQDGINKGYLRQ